MTENAIDLYNEILKITKDIRAAIDRKDWEQINSLVLKRGEYVQQSVQYFAQRDKMSQETRKKIKSIIKAVTEADKENIKFIEDQKDLLGQDRIKVNIGQKALNAYKGMGNIMKQRYDQDL